MPCICINTPWRSVATSSCSGLKKKREEKIPSQLWQRYMQVFFSASHRISLSTEPRPAPRLENMLAADLTFSRFLHAFWACWALQSFTRASRAAKNAGDPTTNRQVPRHRRGSWYIRLQALSGGYIGRYRTISSVYVTSLCIIPALLAPAGQSPQGRQRARRAAWAGGAVPQRRRAGPRQRREKWCP